MVVLRDQTVEIIKQTEEWTGQGEVLLVCDLWEHAYYPLYKEDVQSYLDDWRKHVDWSHLSISPKL